MTLREHSAALKLLDKWKRWARNLKTRGAQHVDAEFRAMLEETEKFLDVDEPAPKPPESHGQRRG